MGQKVDPVGIRLGIVHDWNSKWFAKGPKFAHYVRQDTLIRDFIAKQTKDAFVSKVKIERPGDSVKIIICSSRPGVLIGKKGGGIDALRTQLSNKIKIPVNISVEEIKKPDLDAKLVAESIAQQLERRVMFRRAMKKSAQSVMKSGALGVRVAIAGRIGGAEIARTEWIKDGRVPLHTFRADIDYGTARAATTYGIIGVKIWIYRGEVSRTDTKYMARNMRRGKLKDVTENRESK